MKSTQTFVNSNMIGALAEESIGKSPDVQELKKAIINKRKDLEALKVQMMRKIEEEKKKYEAQKAEAKELRELEKGCREVKPGESKMVDTEESDEIDEETKQKLFEEQKQALIKLEADA